MINTNYYSDGSTSDTFESQVVNTALKEEYIVKARNSDLLLFCTYMACSL